MKLHQPNATTQSSFNWMQTMRGVRSCWRVWLIRSRESRRSCSNLLISRKRRKAKAVPLGAIGAIMCSCRIGKQCGSMNIQSCQRIILMHQTTRCRSSRTNTSMQVVSIRAISWRTRTRPSRQLPGQDWRPWLWTKTRRLLEQLLPSSPINGMLCRPGW